MFDKTSRASRRESRTMGAGWSSNRPTTPGKTARLPRTVWRSIAPSPAGLADEGRRGIRRPPDWRPAAPRRVGPPTPALGSSRSNRPVSVPPATSPPKPDETAARPAHAGRPAGVGGPAPAGTRPAPAVPGGLVRQRTGRRRLPVRGLPRPIPRRPATPRRRGVADPPAVVPAREQPPRRSVPRSSRRGRAAPPIPTR